MSERDPLDPPYPGGFAEAGEVLAAATDDDVKGILGGAAARSAGDRIRAAVERDEAAAAEPDPPQRLEQPPPDPFTVACPSCHGYGETYTGSLVERHMFRDCPTCDGRGFILADQPLEGLPQAGDQRTAVFTDAGGWKWES